MQRHKKILGGHPLGKRVYWTQDQLCAVFTRRKGTFVENFNELQKKYAGTLIGDYICFFMEKNRNTVEDKALYYGLQALLETRHSS